MRQKYLKFEKRKGYTRWHEVICIENFSTKHTLEWKEKNRTENICQGAIRHTWIIELSDWVIWMKIWHFESLGSNWQSETTNRPGLVPRDRLTTYAESRNKSIFDISDNCILKLDVGKKIQHLVKQLG